VAATLPAMRGSPRGARPGVVRRLLAREGEIARAAAQNAGVESGRVVRRDTFLPAQLAIVAAIGLYLALPAKLTLGPDWLLPSAEALLLVGLIVTVPSPARPYTPARRHLAIALIGLVSVAYLASLYLLVHFLLKGGKAGGHPLILSGVILWVTNVLIFALWYWELDRAGPVARLMRVKVDADFLFPQMTDDAAKWVAPGWMPGFIDYLYVSVTNATAFSPTDTMPLSAMAKVLMGIQGVASLTTIGLVVARAVNILA
jgi:hypothetical protein